MTSRTWEALVDEGVRLAKADPLDRWALGDLCVEVVGPLGNSGTKEDRTAAQRELARFASDAKLSLSLLKDCYRTSKAYPEGQRFPGISQAKHSKYAARPNRVSLLLNDEMVDGLSLRVREQVEKVEQLLVDKAVRAALLDRSNKRSRRIVSAAKAIEDEELTKARVNQRIQEQDAKARLAAPEILSKMAERAIKGNVALAKMVTDLLDLNTVVEQIPIQYHERTIENLERIVGAAEKVLNTLRPETRSPQPRTVIVDI